MLRRFPFSRQGFNGIGSILDVVTPSLWLQANQGTTLVSGAVSQWDDLSGNGNNAAQGSAVNRPYLSAAANNENFLLYSADATNAVWDKATYPVTVVGTTVTATASAARHGLYQIPAYPARPAGISYRNIFEVGYNNYQYAIWGVNTDAVWHVVCIDLLNGVLGTATNCTATITQISNGRFKVIVEWTMTDAAAPVCFIGLGTSLNNTSLPSWTPAGTEKFEFYYAAAQRAAALNTYLPTTSYPIYAGLNNNQTLVFDGSNDALVTPIYPTVSSGCSVSAIVVPNIASTTQVIVGADDGSVNSRFRLALGAIGEIYCRAYNGSGNRIGRTSGVASYTSGIPFVLTATYDGGASAGGIKIYKNGAQIDAADDNGGAYSVPVGASSIPLYVGARDGTASQLFNGKYAELVFNQGTPFTYDQRQTIESILIRRYGIY